MFFFSPFSRYSELFVHGLGAAIHRAINLALQLKETSSHTLEVRRYNTTPSRKALHGLVVNVFFPPFPLLNMFYP